MQRWFLSLLGTSLSTGALIAVFCALCPLLLRRYTGRMRRLVWLILALRLLFGDEGVFSLLKRAVLPEMRPFAEREVVRRLQHDVRLA